MANINKNEIGYNENTTANALMVQYKRGLAAPMDISEVFTSLTSAQHYAKGDPIAYAGQTIAVAGEGIKTEVYKITSGGTLVRLVDEDALTNINKTIEDNEEVTSAALNELNSDIKQLYKAVNDKASEISNISQIIEENERVCADSISELNEKVKQLINDLEKIKQQLNIL